MSDWRSIETAPLDGTEILIFVPGLRQPIRVSSFDTHRHVLNGELLHESKGWSLGPLSSGTPTHWMPLPIFPGAKGPA